MVRIDHFRGLVAYWETPAGEKTALKGKWQQAPFHDFMNSLFKYFAALPVIAEDLGMITPDVREGMRFYHIPGIKMLLFAFSEEMNEKAFLPHNHIKNCVAYTTTHDTNTCVGWFEKPAKKEEKKQLFDYVGREIKEEVNWEFIRMAMSSVAGMAISQIQDVLGLGADARMNTPGNAGGNWLFRFQMGQLTPPLRARLKEMTEVYDRA